MSDQTPPTVSVIVATYNRAHYLPECLNSLLAQSRPPDEILVIDDGSSDGTREIAERYAPQVRCLSQPNQGRPSALNLGIKHAIGSHLVFFDDDDVMLPEALALHLDVLDTPGADYSYSPNMIFEEEYDGDSIWDESRHMFRKHCQTAEPEELFLRTLEWGEYFLIYLQGMMIPRRLIEQIGRFQTALLRGQDYAVMLELAWHYRGVSTHAPTFVMREHAGGRGPASERHGQSERQAMWAKYDRQIIEPYWKTLPLDAYLPHRPAKGADYRLSRRETVDAMLARSRVMFSHGLFEEGVSDIGTIADMAALPEDQWAATVALVQHAANIEKPHFIAGSHALQRDIGRRAQSRARRTELMSAAARGFYWGARRFLRHRDPRATATLLLSMARLLARRTAVERLPAVISRA